MNAPICHKCKKPMPNPLGKGFTCCDGSICEICDGWIDYTNLGSVFYHEHAGLPEPWGITGEKLTD